MAELDTGKLRMLARAMPTDYLNDPKLEALALRQAADTIDTLRQQLAEARAEVAATREGGGQA